MDNTSVGQQLKNIIVFFILFIFIFYLFIYLFFFFFVFLLQNHKLACGYSLGPVLTSFQMKIFTFAAEIVFCSLYECVLEITSSWPSSGRSVQCTAFLILS